MRKGEWIMKKLILFGDSIMKGVTFNGSGYHLCPDHDLPQLAARGIDLAGAIRHVREQVGHTTHIEVEVDRLDQIPAVLAGGADTIMLDNFSLDDTRRGVELIDGKAIVEASGNMSLERVPAVAVTGVDVISVGALTHSVRSIDLGLDWN